MFITFCTEIHTSKRRTNLRRLFFSAEKLVEKTTKTCDKNALIIHTNVMNFVTKLHIFLQNMIFVYLSKIDELEKIGSTVSKNSANLMSSGFSA